jgi:hypothetical protein
MADVVQRQAALLTRPPRSVEEVLAALAIFAPTFAADLVNALRQGRSNLVN